MERGVSRQRAPSPRSARNQQTSEKPSDKKVQKRCVGMGASATVLTNIRLPSRLRRGPVRRRVTLHRKTKNFSKDGGAGAGVRWVGYPLARNKRLNRATNVVF